MTTDSWQDGWELLVIESLQGLGLPDVNHGFFWDGADECLHRLFILFKFMPPYPSQNQFTKVSRRSWRTL